MIKQRLHRDLSKYRREWTENLWNERQTNTFTLSAEVLEEMNV